MQEPMRSKEAKIAFIEQLTTGVTMNIVANIDKIPEHWDGIELRRYIADKFEESTMVLQRGTVRSNGYSKRLKAYHNDVIVNNL